MTRWIVEQLAGDDNDVDQYGMDAQTRKRLKVKNRFERAGKKKVVKPMRSQLPQSLSRDESVRRANRVLGEAIDALCEGQHYDQAAIRRIMNKYNLKRIMDRSKEYGGRGTKRDAAETLYDYLRYSYGQPPEEMGVEIFGDAVGGCIHEMLS